MLYIKLCRQLKVELSVVADGCYPNHSYLLRYGPDSDFAYVKIS